jgi:hypothetical protein
VVTRPGQEGGERYDVTGAGRADLAGARLRDGRSEPQGRVRPYSTVLSPVHPARVMVVESASGFCMNGPRVTVCAGAEAAIRTAMAANPAWNQRRTGAVPHMRAGLLARPARQSQ